MNKFVDVKCKVYNMFSWFKILLLHFVIVSVSYYAGVSVRINFQLLY